jgi:hypothetical protein
MYLPVLGDKSYVHDLDASVINAMRRKYVRRLGVRGSFTF